MRLNFPNEGCRKAYECGQELYLRGCGLDQEILAEALSFCENDQERVYFCMALVLEACDLEEVLHT